MKLRLLFALFAFTVFLASPGIAQVNTSTIAGAVTDESGSAVPNAKVVITLLGTGQQRETATNDAGEFVLPQFAPGAYRVNVTAPGFQTGVVENLTLNIAERAIGQRHTQGRARFQRTGHDRGERAAAGAGDRVARTGDHPQSDQRSSAERPQLSHARIAFSRSDPAVAGKHRVLQFHRLHVAAIRSQPAGRRAAGKLNAAICMTVSRCAIRVSATVPSHRRSMPFRNSRFNATSSRPSSATRRESST